MPSADARVEIHPPRSVVALMERLWAHGHGAYVVGGSVRDTLLGRAADDWDLATDARPDRLLAIFPGSVYENRFGTVAVTDAGTTHEVTTFRTDHEYADFRRPHRVEFGDDLELDLARRDFTVNAIAWGAPAPGPASEPASAPPTASLVDPFGGVADVRAMRLRAVGEPAARFREDALRMVRAVRLAAVLEFEIEPATLGAIHEHAPLAAHVSAERITAEVQKLLLAARPSIGLRLMVDTGLLAVLLPEIAHQRGIPQNKIEGEDLLDHTLRTVDATPAGRPVVRLTALFHDVGKPATIDQGPFRGHEVAGADIAERMLLERLRLPKAVVERVVHLVRNHMFAYEPDWGDAGVRRFIQRVRTDSIEDLFALREADNAGSGLPRDAGLAELRTRVNAELAAAVVLDRSRLAVDGNDLMTELGVPAGPHLGRILDRLLEHVIADPAVNDRATLLVLAGSMLTEDG